MPQNGTFWTISLTLRDIFWGGGGKMAFFGLWNALSGVPRFRALYGAGTIAALKRILAGSLERDGKNSPRTEPSPSYAPEVLDCTKCFWDRVSLHCNEDAKTSE